MRTQTAADKRTGTGDGAVEALLKRCIHCGLCAAACPTFVMYRDERDSPRGRITLMRSMFEAGRASDQHGRRHIDRCLSCLSCMTACPSGVDYQHLVQHARMFVEETSRRPLQERVARWMVRTLVPHPARFRWALRLAPLGRRMGSFLRLLGFRQVAAMAEIGAVGFRRGGAAYSGPGTASVIGRRRGRVLLPAGCAQQIARPEINDATIRLLARRGVEVEVPAGSGCCGAVSSQLGQRREAVAFAKRNVDAWAKALSRDETDAIISNTSGCGTAIRDYPHLLKDEPAHRAEAGQIAAKTKDVVQFLADFDLGPPVRWSSLKVAYHSDCGLKHGLGVRDEPAALLRKAGFTVVALEDGDICCGAAGLHSVLEPDIAADLRARKIGYIRRVRPDVVATGSINCVTHLGQGMDTPVVHLVELLDWAYGGPVPRGLEALKPFMNAVPLTAMLKPEDYLEPLQEPTQVP